MNEIIKLCIECRKKCKRTITDVADDLKVHYNTIYNFEKGKNSTQRIILYYITEFFSVEDFLEFEKLVKEALKNE